jgi:hypothetical protein
MVFVIKADGNKEPFDAKKIYNTCIRAGADDALAKQIANAIAEQVQDGWTTHKIYKLVIEELEKTEHKSAFLFPMRHAITELGSENFEVYTKKILEAHGYECEWNKIIQGSVVEHQVDVIARKDKTYLIECKHHTNPHRFCGLGVMLQVFARLEDVQDGFKDKKNKYDFAAAWVFNNTKFSYHAKKYADAKGIRLSGWGYKKELSLETMVTKKKIYPVTILKIGNDVHKKLLQNNIITIQDLIENKNTIKYLKKPDLTNIINQAQQILS